MFKVVQLTDSHLLEDTDRLLYNINMDDTFLKCIELAVSLVPDLLILSGDIADNGSEKAYKRIKRYLDQLGISYVVIPGNHDNIKNLVSVFKKNAYIDQAIQLRNWNLIFLDTTVDKQAHGFFKTESIATIKNFLKENFSPTAVFLHHPPMHLDSPLIDQYCLQNMSEFWEEINSHKQIKFISCGHVHQEYEIQKNEIKFYTTPSTGLQFKPQMEKFELDTLAPGLRYFELSKDGNHMTKICRVEKNA